MEKQTKAIEKFQEEVDSEIMNHRIRIAKAEEANEKSPDDEREAKIASLKGALEVLKEIMADKDCRKKRLESNRSWKADLVVEAFAALSADVEDAFTHALLMQPDEREDAAIEEFDLQEEYQEKANGDNIGLIHQQADDGFANRYFEQYLAGAPQELDTTPAIRKHEPTEEQLAKQTLMQAVWDAEDHLKTVQMWFDRKEDEQRQDQEDEYQRRISGQQPAYTSTEQFDLHWVAVNRQMIRDLVEAEEGYSQAKAAAKAAGVQFQSKNQSSCFGTDNPGENVSDPGYPLSQEVNIPAAAAWVTPRVEGWMEDVPEDLEPVPENARKYAEDCLPEQSSEMDLDDCPDDAAEGTSEKADSACEMEIDDWDFKEIEFGDSLSCVGYGNRHQKIAKWQRDCQVAYSGGCA